MKILITGASGLIGNYLLEYYLKDNDVIAIYRNSKPRVQDVSSNIKFIRHDISQDIKGLEHVDIIIHAAAHTHLITHSTAFDYIQSNIMGTLSLANYAKVIRPRLFIFLSTLSAYGEILADEINEDTPLNKPEMYGLSKYTGELILKEYEDYFPSICIRLPGVVGAGYFTPWIGSVLIKAAKDDPITIYNSESIFNNIVDLSEIQRFISWISDREFSGSDSFNLAANEPITIRKVVDLIVSLTGSQSKIIEQDTNKKSFSIETEKVNQIFGFIPTSTTKIICRYVEQNKIDLSKYKV